MKALATRVLLIAIATSVLFVANAFAKPPSGVCRLATYNTSLHRDKAGKLIADLRSDSEQAKQIAEVLQRVAPDIVLLNEFDYDSQGVAARLFQEHYLSKPQAPGLKPLAFAHQVSLPVNTGVDSGKDLNQDGKQGGPGDAWGFGRHPGQYGMLLLSKYPIERLSLRTFQRFLWSKMPGALTPTIEERDWYPTSVWRQLRLSSKSHWDVPLRIGDQVVHILASHPTPPVFDGPEDRNGRRNHDEIRLWADYVRGGDSARYLKDDQHRTGGLEAGALFVVAGDLNADPQRGESRDGAIEQLLGHARIQGALTPRNVRGESYTADFGSNRRYRVDYLLPSRGLQVVGSGVFWPSGNAPGAQAVQASDHRPVWIDIRVAE